MNRGIEDPDIYLSVSADDCCSYNDLDNIDAAVECFVKHFEKKDIICVIADNDPDGYSSATMVYRYIKLLEKDYPVYCVLHKNNKTHGLDSNDVEIKDGTKLLIIPDASTNDYIQCNGLIDKGIDIIITDHHQPEDGASLNKSIIINNQMSGNYSCKEYCGCGVTNELLRAIDDYYLASFSDRFDDLVAFANISDDMDIRSLQTRHYINKGIKKFDNEFLLSLAKAQKSQTKGSLTIHNIQWYLTPILNSLIRIGTFEERTQVFNAMLGDDTTYGYKKRGEAFEIEESASDHAARICKSLKSKQDRLRDKLFEKVIGLVDPSDKAPILITDETDSAIIGLTCIKVASAIQKPVILLYDDGSGILRGSGRNPDDSPVKDFKAIVSNTHIFEFAAGHPNAFGVGLLKENLETAKQKLEYAMEHIEFDDSTPVDFVFDGDEIGVEFVYDVNSLDWLWGKNLEEPTILVKDMVVEDAFVYGKNENVVAFISNDIKFIRFNADKKDPIMNAARSKAPFRISVIGTVSVNEYNGTYTPQFIIDEYEIGER